MQQTGQNSPKDCWVDFFESSYFMGKMRRLFGPRQLKRLSAGSIIVGPAASLHLQCRRSGQKVKLQLKSNRLIPDLPATLRGAVLNSASVICGRTHRSPAAKTGSRNGVPQWIKPRRSH